MLPPFLSALGGGVPALGYASLAEAHERLPRFFRESPEPGYAYVYFPSMDSLSYEQGTGGLGVRATVAAVDRFLEGLSEGLDARIVVAADRGQVEVPHERRLRLAEVICAPHCGASLPGSCS